jgi:hypothetical protein
MTQNKRLIGIVLTVVFLMLIPIIAMQFTDEVKWPLPDFAVAASSCSALVSCVSL